MMPDPILVLGWLVLGHLLADFVFQTGRVAQLKSGAGRDAALGLLVHGLVVGACLVPVGLAFAERGWAYVGVSAVSHVVIDRAKVILTRRAAAAALRGARERHEEPQPADHLGRAWTPAPAALFLADQAAHVVVLAWAWAVLLATAPLAAGWTSAVDGWLDGWDRGAVHATVAAAVVLVALTIVNVRAASLFVAILVRPVEAGMDGTHRWGGRAAPHDEPAQGAAPAAAAAPAAIAATRRWTIRLGPLDARLTAEPEGTAGPGSAGPGSAAASLAPAGSTGVPVGASARVGATIGILERVLIVIFVLTGSDVAIGFVVAVKTLARFKLLDDRAFAEYYLLGTLASVAVAIVTALVGRAALTALLA